MQSTLSHLILLLASSHAVYGFFRMSAGLPLVIARVDPIDFPGVKSPHVHSVNGGNGFHPNSTFDDLRKSTCTTNLVAEDKSNYWVPRLYFHDPTNDSYSNVPNGGLLTYYLKRLEAGEKITAFPAGFRMLTGNASKLTRNWDRNIRDSQQWKDMTLAEQQEALAEQSITWVCFGKGGNTYSANDPSPSAFPSIDCPNGFRSELFFPSCWDGKYLDSPDHRSHVAYPDRHDNGVCPPGYPVRIPSLFYEHTWDIGVFSSRWPSDGKWPFEWGMKDSTGWGFHGDFLNGWDVDLLQQAMEKCPDSGVIEDCEPFTRRKLLQTPEQQRACKIEDPFNEHADGVLTSLPSNGYERPNGSWVPVGGSNTTT